MPERVAADAGLKVAASATDEVGVVGIDLFVDGALLAHSDEDALRYNIDTRALAPGAHELRVEARDAAGHVASVAAAVQLDAPAPAAPTEAPAPSASPTAPPPAAASPAAPSPAAPAAPAAPAVTVQRGQITIDTYGYEEALYTDAAQAGHPYPLLARERIQPVRPVRYETVVLRNGLLELTFLPALGGRLYQCRLVPTGQTLLYNNPVIKPTGWGPEDQGWWLAAGGIEWALPVHEHGYVSAQPWQADIARHDDGSATVTLSLQEQSHALWTTVAVTLRPGDARFEIVSTLTNRSAEAQRFQYWINAMLAPGGRGIRPTLRFYLPTTEVMVHSTGDATLPAPGAALPWPSYQGRDLSAYSTWQQWLGVFATHLDAPYLAVYDPAVELGMVRVTPPELAGHKLFGLGADFDYRAYSDDAAQYVELWSGLTPTFWDDAELAPGDTTGWREVWYPISRCGGVSAATEEATLYVTVDGDRATIHLYAPRPAQWTLVVQQGSEVRMSQPIAVGPQAPYSASLPLAGGNPSEPINVQVMNASGDVVVSHALPRAAEGGR